MSANGCRTTSSGSTFATIPVNLPLGATVTSFGAVIFDATGNSSYEVDLYRQRTDSAPLGQLQTTIAAHVNGGAATVQEVTQRAALPSGYSVNATDNFLLGLDLGAASTNAFCRASLTYTMP